MSSSNIVSVQEMIDEAFGKAEGNRVDFKLFQAILYILARQLRILERQVLIVIEPTRLHSSSSLSITEIKIEARMQRKLGKIGNKAGAISSNARVGKRLPDRTKKLPEDELSEIIKSSYDKTKSSSEKTKTTSEDTTSPSEKTKTISEKTKTTPKDKTSPSEKTKSSLEETSKSEKTKSLSEKTKLSSEKTKSPSDRTTPTLTITSTTKTPSDKTKSTTDKTKSTTDKTTSSTTISSKEDKRSKSDLLELLEQKRERELRVIHQRTDSRDEAERTPTPMESMDSIEVKYEKLLIVERLPADKVTSRKSQSRDEKASGLSIVTQDQFEELARMVKELQIRFGSVGQASFPENMQLMQELRKGASLTDAMAALQLSARLEAAEKALENMMELVTQLVRRPDTDGSKLETKVIFKAAEPTKPSEIIHKKPKTKVETPPVTGEIEIVTASPSKVIQKDTEVAVESAQPLDWINVEELNGGMRRVHDSILQIVTTSTSKAMSTADNALSLAKKLEKTLEHAVDVRDRMDDLENLIIKYTEKVTALDTGLSSQMTNYQEQLTQMQHDLESGIEGMAEALANIGGDPEAIMELNTNFTNLQIDIDATYTKQKNLQESQMLLSLDLESLKKEIELIREIKSDRDEVTDALRDKAGIDALNGLVHQAQFDAVRGDFEKRISAAYDKFNNQELIWQKVIDEQYRDLNEKADSIQVESLRDSIHKNLEKLKNKLEAMMEIVGEPRAAAVSKRLFRDTACLSCSEPAHIDAKEPIMVPALPTLPKVWDHGKPRDDGDHGMLCYPGLRIPHPIDSRAKFCQRYCGGSHTMARSRGNILERAPMGMIITPARPEANDDITDEKDQSPRDRKPCIPCNLPKLVPTREPSEATQCSIDIRPSIYSMPEDINQQLNFMQHKPEDCSKQSHCYKINSDK